MLPARSHRPGGPERYAPVSAAAAAAAHRAGTQTWTFVFVVSDTDPRSETSEMGGNQSCVMSFNFS